MFLHRGKLFSAGTGLASKSLQICTDGTTNCTTIVANPGTTGSYLYEGQPDHTYTFRVTATDHVDNTTTKEQTFGTASITKYYLFGGQRVAMRVGTGAQSAVSYLHGNHPSTTLRTGLGRFSMTTNALGEIIQMRFMPIEENSYRTSPSGIPTTPGAIWKLQEYTCPLTVKDTV